MMYQEKMLSDMLVKLPLLWSPTKEDDRQGKSYSLFLGVPVKCLSVQGSEEYTKFGSYILDLLICRGREAVLAIVFDAEYRNMEELFSTYLQALPHLFVKLDGLTAESAGDICGEVQAQLRGDKNDPRHTGYYLPFILASRVISKVAEPPAQNWNLLKALRYADSLRQAEEKGEATDYFPLIYDLLVESVSGAVGAPEGFHGFIKHHDRLRNIFRAEKIRQKRVDISHGICYNNHTDAGIVHR